MNSHATQMWRERINDSSGAVLILMAMLCVILIGLLGLALDSMLLASGKSKQERVSEYAALAALEAYQATTSTSTDPVIIYNTKVAAAHDRANRLSGVQTNFLLTESVSSNQRTAGPLTLHLGGGPLNPSDDGRIIFGVWYFADPSTQIPPVPDCGSGASFSPCFVANTGGETSANAVQVQLRSRDGTLYETLFARILGNQATRLDSVAIAAFQPRRVVFGVDMSGSTDDQSHPTSKYSFRLAGDPGSSYCSTGGTAFDPAAPAGTYTLFDNPNDSTPWSAATQTNYKCWKISVTDPGPSVSTEDQFYMVDDVVRPQPLYSIIDAIHTAMVAFKLRAVKGDEIGILGYDHDILDARRTPTMLRPQDLLYDDWLDYTDLSLPDTVRISDRLLFTRLDSNGPVSHAYTNLPLMLNEAQALLAGGIGPLGADNSIVNFSDGLTNCTIGALGGCGQTIARVNSSLAQVRGIRDADLIPNAITFSNVLFETNRVGAHRMMYRSIDDPDKCMTEGEIRRRGLLLADNDTPNYDDCFIGSARRCFTPNELADVVVPTGGFWIPVLNPCNLKPSSAFGSGACSGSDQSAETKAYLDDRCKNLVAAPGGPLRDFDTYTDTTLNGVNAKGRLQCDLECRTQPQQIASIIDELLRGNPYVLVAELPPPP